MQFQLPWSLSWEDFNFNASFGNLLRTFFKIKIKFDWEFSSGVEDFSGKIKNLGSFPRLQREGKGRGRGGKERENKGQRLGEKLLKYPFPNGNLKENTGTAAAQEDSTALRISSTRVQPAEVLNHRKQEYHIGLRKKFMPCPFLAKLSRVSCHRICLL